MLTEWNAPQRTTPDEIVAWHLRQRVNPVRRQRSSSVKLVGGEPVNPSDRPWAKNRESCRSRWSAYAPPHPPRSASATPGLLSVRSDTRPDGIGRPRGNPRCLLGCRDRASEPSAYDHDLRGTDPCEEEMPATKTSTAHRSPCGDSEYDGAEDARGFARFSRPPEPCERGTVSSSVRQATNVLGDTAEALL